MHTNSRKIPTLAAFCSLYGVAGASLALSCVLFLALRYGGSLALAGIGAAIAGLLAVLLHPFVFFTFYFGALFFADTRLPGVPLSVNQIFAILFLISYASYWIRGRTTRIKSHITPWLTLMAVYFAASAFFGESPEQGRLLARYVVIYYLLALFLASCIRSERALYAYAWIIVTLTFGAACAGLIEAFQKGTFLAFAGKITDAVRVKGATSTANVFGWNLVFAYPFAFFLFCQVRRKVWRFVALAMGVFCLFIALLSLSRQTLVVVLLELLVCARLFRYPSRRLLLTIIAGFFVAGALLVAPSIVARFISVTRLSRDYSYLERRDSAIICFEVIKAKPIWGVGLGSFTAVWRNYLPADYRTFFAQYIEASRPRAPDEGYLQITAEGGIVGLVIFLAFAGAVCVQALRIRRVALAREDNLAFNLGALVLALMIQFLATTFTDDTFLYVRVWLIYPLALLLDKRMLFSSPVEKTLSAKLSETSEEPFT